MNQMSKKEVKIPIAAVFSTLNVLIGLINIFVTYTTYTRIIGIPMSEVHRAVACPVRFGMDRFYCRICCTGIHALSKKRPA